MQIDCVLTQYKTILSLSLKIVKELHTEIVEDILLPQNVYFVPTIVCKAVHRQRCGSHGQFVLP